MEKPNSALSEELNFTSEQLNFLGTSAEIVVPHAIHGILGNNFIVWGRTLLFGEQLYLS